ncbi:MAG: HEAT repeat domain-containing protein [Chloracidobacterium sp.]
MISDHSRKVREVLAGNFRSGRLHRRTKALLVNALTVNPHEEIRCAAAVSLVGEASDPRVQKALCHALASDPSNEVRLSAVGGLAPVTHRSKIQTALVEALAANTCLKVRIAAANALAQIADRPKVQKALLRVLTTEKDGFLRCASASSLMKGANVPRVQRVLLHLLARGEDGSIRQAAGFALTPAAEKPAVAAALVRALTTDHDYAVRMVAARALAAPTTSGRPAWLKQADRILEHFAHEKDKSVAREMLTIVLRAGARMSVWLQPINQKHARWIIALMRMIGKENVEGYVEPIRRLLTSRRSTGPEWDLPTGAPRYHVAAGFWQHLQRETRTNSMSLPANQLPEH